MLIEKMAELKHRLIEYATLVEGMINKSIKGLLEKDENLLEDVIEREEPKANNYDREIDETCTALIEIGSTRLNSSHGYISYALFFF